MQQFNIEEYLNSIPQPNTTISIPLQFDKYSIDILTKQYTKLNNSHKYRIHYLGCRFRNTQQIHKKYSLKCNDLFVNHPQKDGFTQLNKYSVEYKKIINCHFIYNKYQYSQKQLYYRAFQGMNPTLNVQQQFEFNSIFESGNLDCVIKKQVNKIEQNILQNNYIQQFDLFLRIDSNTRGHLQWYYFSIKNHKKMNKIKLNICNFTNSKLLYLSGLKPYIFSTLKHKYFNQNWCQNGQNITFKKKQLKYHILNSKGINTDNLWCLSFQYTFIFPQDQVYFAYCIPYTYSKLLKQLQIFQNHSIGTIHTLCKSLSGINIPIIAITRQKTLKNKQKNNESKYLQWFKNKLGFDKQQQVHKQRIKNEIQEYNKYRDTILITGRIHAGESNSSHLISGLLKYLISQQSYQLRCRMNILIIPMLNPDGVILGNSRTNIMGKDLNRQYPNPGIQLNPQLSAVKQICRKLKSRILVYLDYHGHSYHKNTFIYGPQYQIYNNNYYICRLLPRIIYNINNSFRYYSCIFRIRQNKKSTGRSIMFYQFNIPYTYTIQTSIGLYYDYNEMNINVFNENKWINMGINIAQGLYIFIKQIKSFQSWIKHKNKIKYNHSSIIQKSIIQSYSLHNIYNDLFKFNQSNNTYQQISSDDHNSQENMNQSKAKQFYHIISQNIHNSYNSIQLNKSNSIQQRNIVIKNKHKSSKNIKSYNINNKSKKKPKKNNARHPKKNLLFENIQQQTNRSLNNDYKKLKIKHLKYNQFYNRPNTTGKTSYCKETIQQKAQTFGYSKSSRCHKVNNNDHQGTNNLQNNKQSFDPYKIKQQIKYNYQVSNVHHHRTKNASLQNNDYKSIIFKFDSIGPQTIMNSHKPIRLRISKTKINHSPFKQKEYKSHQLKKQYKHKYNDNQININQEQAVIGKRIFDLF